MKKQVTKLKDGSKPTRWLRSQLPAVPSPAETASAEQYIRRNFNLSNESVKKLLQPIAGSGEPTP